MSTDMEAVNLFNSELSSLYDVKPPISKGKMTSITRAALKAVKLYKHVVQSVEKFIQKCKPEYKIPGLYVIDSIIRQSRHQFGPEKDVFATRFARNLTNTFVHLYKCPDDEKAKIIRVLNLWQKNKIFMPDVIAPLFDLANPNHEIWEKINSQQQASEAIQNNNNSSQSKNPAGTDFGQVHFKKELLDYDYDDDLEPNNENKDKNMGGLSQQSQLSQQQQQHVPQPQSSLTDKIPQNVLSGFDALGSLLANPEVLRQLQTLQEQMAAAAAQQSQISQFSTPEQERQRKLAELNKQEAAFEQRLAQTVARLPFAVDCDFDASGKQDEEKLDAPYQPPPPQQQAQNQNMAQLLPPVFFHQLENTPMPPGPPPMNIFDQNFPFGGPPPPTSIQLQQQQQQAELISQGMYSHFNNFNQQQQQQQQQQQLQPVFEDKDRGQRPRRRSRDTIGNESIRAEIVDYNRNDFSIRSRSPLATDRGRKSRSRSRSRSRRKSRSGSRGRSNRRKYTRSRSRERREEKEREKERARKGFPVMRKDHVSICSTTLWVGHLSKLVSQEEISDTFGAYGDIVSIDLISPRGCAFVVMNRRQDALRALDRLRNVKLQGKAITLAWAPGKSVKGREWKDYWEVEQGVSYIPWTKLRPDTNIDEFEDGGCIDEDTLPGFLKDRPKLATSGGDQQPDKESSGVPPPSQNIPKPVAAPLLPTPTSVQMLIDSNSSSQQQQTNQPPAQQSTATSADTDARPELNAVAAAAAAAAAAHVSGQPLGPVPNPGPGMVQSFVGLPRLMGNMGMGPQFGMMVPPPILTGPRGPGGQGMPPFGPPSAMLGVMGQGHSGMMGQGPSGMMGPGAPGGPSLGTPNNSGAGLLGDMPMVHPAVLQQQMNNSMVDIPGGSGGPLGGTPFDPEMKRLRSTDDDSRSGNNPEGQKRKKSRFEDVPDDSKTLDRSKDDRVPLHERLKNIADYGMENRGSLLGTPRGPPGLNNLLFPNGQPPPIVPTDHVGVRPGFIRPLFPSPSSANAALPIQTNPSGGTNWFDNNDSSNPFVNPNNPNPFIGNPFIQQQAAVGGGNPFDVNASFEGFSSPATGGRGWSQQNQNPPPQKWGGSGSGRDSTRGGTWGRGDRRDDRYPPDRDNWRRDTPRRDSGREDRDRDHRDSSRDHRSNWNSSSSKDRSRRNFDSPHRESSGSGDSTRRSRRNSGDNAWSRNSNDRNLSSRSHRGDEELDEESKTNHPIKNNGEHEELVEGGGFGRENPWKQEQQQPPEEEEDWDREMELEEPASSEQQNDNPNENHPPCENSGNSEGSFSREELPKDFVKVENPQFNDPEESNINCFNEERPLNQSLKVEQNEEQPEESFEEEGESPGNDINEQISSRDYDGPSHLTENQNSEDCQDSCSNSEFPKQDYKESIKEEYSNEEGENNSQVYNVKSEFPSEENNTFHSSPSEEQQYQRWPEEDDESQPTDTNLEPNPSQGSQNNWNNDSSSPGALDYTTNNSENHHHPDSPISKKQFNVGGNNSSNNSFYDSSNNPMEDHNNSEFNQGDSNNSPKTEEREEDINEETAMSVQHLREFNENELSNSSSTPNNSNSNNNPAPASEEAV